MVFLPFFNVTMFILTVLIELIISLLMNCRLVRTPPTVSKNAEVPSWWKGSSKSNSSSLHSMMFEDNVGEDGLSAQSSYIIDINDSNYINNLEPDPAMFDNEVLLGNDTLKKVYTQLISALNEIRIQKNTGSTLSVLWNGKYQNTCIGQVNASSVVVECDDIDFFDDDSRETASLVFGRRSLHQVASRCTAYP
jgi:hypothetical protein